MKCNFHLFLGCHKMSRILAVSLSINLTEEICQKELKGYSAKKITLLQISCLVEMGWVIWLRGEQNTPKTDPPPTHRSVLGVF